MPSGDASDRGPQGPATQVKATIDPGGDLSFGSPTPADGTDLWNLAREAGNLDVNSRYASCCGAATSRPPASSPATRKA